MKCYLIHSNHHLNPQSPVKMRFVISAKWRRFQTHYFYGHFHSNSKGDHVKIHSNHSKEDGILTTKINLFNLRREAIVEMILKKPLSWFNNNNWLFFINDCFNVGQKKKTLNLYIRPICLKIYFPSIQKPYWLLLRFIAFSDFYRKISNTKLIVRGDSHGFSRTSFGRIFLHDGRCLAIFPFFAKFPS